MKLLHNAFAVVRDFRRPYIALNAIYYGLVVLGMIYVTFNPSLQQSLLDSVGASFGAGGPLAAVGSAYGNAQVLQAMVLTFVVNLLLGALAEIGLPSLIIPFFGVLMGVTRAILWGLLLSPANAQLRWAMVPHSLTLLLEGQGYILAMLAAYIQARATFWPKRVGAENPLKGYVAGLKRSALLYVLVALVLAAAAIYEAIEVTAMVRLAG